MDMKQDTSANLPALASIALSAEVTGVAWRSLSRFYALPEDLAGLKVLDVCAGMSDSVYRLRQEGAEAYAVDTCYADLATMYASHRAGFEITARSVFRVEPDSTDGQRLYRSFTEGFEAGLKTCPYVAASATALPFPDACFDLVLSFNGIFGTLDFDAGVLAVALREALRVTKPGGSIQLVPFQEGLVLNDRERAIQREGVQALAGISGVELHEAVARSEAGLGRVNRLTIRLAG
jgi:SAM-dependent methyltransferase